MQTIATEKTTNYILRPVLKTRLKKEFPYKLDPVDNKKDGILMIDNYWTAKHHMMLDVLTNESLAYFEGRVNKGEIFTSHYKEKVMAEAAKISADDLRYLAKKENFVNNKSFFEQRLDAIEPEFLSLNEKELIKKYRFLNNMTSSQICQLLKDISETKIKCGFRVKILTDKQDNFTHYKYYMWAPESLIKYKDRVLEQTKHDPPRVKLREYHIEFSGIVGRLFAHNIKALNVIRVPVEIYKLSQDAQFIYRRFIGTMVIPKGKSVSGKFMVEHEDIEKYLDMKVAHITYKAKRIQKALDELKNAGLIEYENTRVRRNDYTIYNIRRCL